MVMRHLKSVILALALLLPLSAAGRTDSVYVFRFVSKVNMFYVPWKNNRAELERLEKCIERYKQDIIQGRIIVHVDGYCASTHNEGRNLHIAKIRSNRVKSELILRQGLTEECFVTQNHSGDGEYVSARIVFPSEADPEADTAGRFPDESEPFPGIPEGTVADTALGQNPPGIPGIPASPVASCRQGILPAKRRMPEHEGNDLYADKLQTHVSISANLLRWASLTPDLGIEWRICPSIGIRVNGSWTSWTWNDAGRRYALWEISPEIRWYIGENKRWYAGLAYKAGQFHYKFSPIGQQGDLTGGGVTGGYHLKLARNLSLDFNLGIGYLHAKYERYHLIDGVRVRYGQNPRTRNWWGPVNAGVSLTWEIPYGKEARP